MNVFALFGLADWSGFLPVRRHSWGPQKYRGPGRRAGLGLARKFSRRAARWRRLAAWGR